MVYPEGLSGYAMCVVDGGHLGPNCSRCGEINYAWLGYMGAVARWAKAWGVTKVEAERRITHNQEAEWRRKHESGKSDSKN